MFTYVFIYVYTYYNEKMNDEKMNDEKIALFRITNTLFGICSYIMCLVIKIRGNNSHVR